MLCGQNSTDPGWMFTDGTRSNGGEMRVWRFPWRTYATMSMRQSAEQENKINIFILKRLYMNCIERGFSIVKLFLAICTVKLYKWKIFHGSSKRPTCDLAKYFEFNWLMASSVHKTFHWRISGWWASTNSTKILCHTWCWGCGNICATSSPRTIEPR